MQPVDLIEQPEQPVLVIHTKTRVENLPQVIGQSYEKIIAYIAETGGLPAGPPFVAYHNIPAPDEDLEVEMGFPVAQAYSGVDEVEFSHIPAGKAVSIVYTGPYSQLNEPYTEMQHWLDDHGYKPTGVAYEYYLTGPEVPEHQHITRIVVPVE